MRNLLFVAFCLFPLMLLAQNSGNTQESIASDTTHRAGIKPLTIVSYAVPALMITYGIVSLENPALKKLDYSSEYELHEDRSLLYNKLDNYLQFAPAAAAFTMQLCGVRGKHQLVDMAILYALSTGLESGVVSVLKNGTQRTRPDGSSQTSFPSGHTATAFVAAEFLHQEYKDKSAWISVGGYAMATMIGVSRVYNDKHWISDVVAGAGIGMLSTKLIYLGYPYVSKYFHASGSAKSQTWLVPSYEQGHLGLYCSMTF